MGGTEQSGCQKADRLHLLGGGLQHIKPFPSESRTVLMEATLLFFDL